MSKFVVLFQLFDEYLISESKDWIRAEYQQTKNLSEHARQQLVNTMVEFIYMFFGVKIIQKSHKVMTISAIMQIFPDLVTTGHEEQFVVSFS